MTETHETLLISHDGPVATITLNRPTVLNALNTLLLRELSTALTELEHSESTRAIVITGAGEKAFAAGADISELHALNGAREGSEKARIGQTITLHIERLRLPVIMAVNGYALGGGCELAMAGDIILASENAKFGQPEVNLGMIPGYGGSQRTTRLVGKGMAMYMCLTGETIDAAEAARIGLVQKVLPLGDLLNEAKRIGNVIATKAPLAIAAAKRCINEGAHMSIEHALDVEAVAFGQLVTSADYKEGTSAFLEKRKPVWRGK